MRIRRVDSSGDMTFGLSAAGFWVDAPEGVAQAIDSTLHLSRGEWFIDQTAGVPWDTQVLGNRTASTRDIVVRSAVLGAPGVLSISRYSSAVQRDRRAFDVGMTVQTQFGAMTITAGPGGVVDMAIAQDDGSLLTDDSGAPIIGR